MGGLAGCEGLERGLEAWGERGAAVDQVELKHEWRKEGRDQGEADAKLGRREGRG